MHSILLPSDAGQFGELTVEIASVVETALQGYFLNLHVGLLAQQ